MRFSFRCVVSVLLILSLLSAFLAVSATDIGKKEEAVASIEKHKAELIKLSDQIWAFAETALRAHKSAKTLAEQQGFKPVSSTRLPMSSSQFCPGLKVPTQP